MLTRTIIIAALALGLAGCENWPKIDDSGLEPEIKVTASDYCSVASKIRWHKLDTKDTIHQVRRHNASHDKRCGVPKPPAPQSVASAPTS
jgi:hypothetical protein